MKSNFRFVLYVSKGYESSVYTLVCSSGTFAYIYRMESHMYASGHSIGLLRDSSAAEDVKEMPFIIILNCFVMVAEQIVSSVPLTDCLSMPKRSKRLDYI
jgi:hypothetical protein